MALQRYTVANIVRDIDRKLHTGGTSLTRDFFGALDEGRRSMIAKLKPDELQRTVTIEQALYDQVDQYAVPDDLDEENIIDIKAMSQDRNVNTMNHPLEFVYRSRFDEKRRHARNVFTIIHDSGVKYIKLYHPRGLKTHTSRVINDASSLSDNGTWNTGGNIVNLQVDKLNYISKKYSLKFDFNNSGTTGFIENFTMDSVSIKDYLDIGAIFTWMNVPVFNIVSSITMRIGSSLTDYYSITINSPHNNNQFVVGQNMLKFALEDMTMTGLPNPDAITYVRLEFSTTGQVMTGVNIDNIVARKGLVYDITYQSAFCFIDAVSQEFKQFATANSDYVALEEDTYQILMLETAKTILQESYGNSNRANDDIEKIKAQLSDAYGVYEGNHKDQSVQPHQTVYIFGNMYDGYTDDSLADNDDREGKYYGTW